LKERRWNEVVIETQTKPVSNFGRTELSGKQRKKLLNQLTKNDGDKL